MLLYAVGTLDGGRASTLETTERDEVRDTVMWATGIVLAVVAAGLMVWTELATEPVIILGMLGVLLTAVGARGRRSP